jgi:hypothetical protein
MEKRVKSYDEFSKLFENSSAVENDTVGIFLDDLETKFKKHFPNGYFSGNLKSFLGDSTITIRIGLISDEKDTPNGIRLNDPLNIVLNISSEAGDTIIGNDLLLEPISTSLSVNSSHTMTGRVKIPLRKTTGSLDKLGKTLYKYIDKMVTIVKDNIDDIYGGADLDKKYLIIK